MLSSINPLGERARGQGFWLTVGWYLLGSVLGGLALGVIAGWLGSLLPGGDWRLVAAILVLVTGAALDLSGRAPPSIHRQVDEDWLTRYRGWVYGVGFGLQLGLGVVTIVTTASVYSTALVALLSGSVGFGAVVGIVFGLARAIVILFVAHAEDPGALRAVMRRLQGRLTMARYGVIVCQLALAALAAVALT
jgi:hypothetical protein